MQARKKPQPRNRPCVDTGCYRNAGVSTSALGAFFMGRALPGGLRHPYWCRAVRETDSALLRLSRVHRPAPGATRRLMAAIRRAARQAGALSVSLPATLHHRRDGAAVDDYWLLLPIGPNGVG